MSAPVDVGATLAAAIAEVARRPDVAATLRPETRLGEGGLGLDSVAFLELVVAIEEQLGVTLGMEAVEAGVLATYGSLRDYVVRERPVA